MSEEMTATATTTAIPPASEEVKKCIYYECFNEEEKTLYDRVSKSHGLDDEITMLKIRIIYLARHDLLTMNILIRAMLCIDRLARTNQKVFQAEKDQDER